MRVAINGFGRIGRAVFRLLNEHPQFRVVAVNDLAEPGVLAYLLRYDTVMGRFPDRVELDGEMLRTSRQTVRMLRVPEPSALPWGDLGVDCVVEATGAFRRRAQLQAHLDAGARRVLLTVPAKDEIDTTVVMGVNDQELRPEHRIVSNASCTTNCLAPLVLVLDRAFGIERALMTTVHAYTNDQRLADVPHTDWRRARAAAENIIPTTTGAARAVGKVLPHLAGRIDGLAARVPVPDGSVVDLVAELRTPVSPGDVNRAVAEAAADPTLRRIIRYVEGPVVSSDVIGDPHSCVFDAEYTRMIGDRVVKVLAWYDNEWGYSNRVVDLLERLQALGPPPPA
ncbi:type I glyceraldehyde-3-phosphate dehydrogenase [Deferrisoma palaeochoriense]